MSLSITITPYDTAQAVWDAYMEGLSEAAGEDMSEYSMEASSSEGAAVSIPVKDMVAVIEKMGAWGFMEDATNDIHVWFSEGCTPRRKLQVLGHELAHVIDNNPPRIDEPTDEEVIETEERWADEVSGLIIKIVQAAGLLPEEEDDDS